MSNRYKVTLIFSNLASAQQFAENEQKRIELGYSSAKCLKFSTPTNAKSVAKKPQKETSISAAGSVCS
jgi:hypothetical protein